MINSPLMQRILTLLFIGAVVFMGWEAYGLYRSIFPNMAILSRAYPIVVYRGPDKPFRVELKRNRPTHWVSLNDISKQARTAVILSEDAAFYQHHGYDPDAIKEALKHDLEKRSFARGASTLTQQVVKNVFLEHEKRLWRKLKEFILAVRLEKAVGKARILEVYFNIAEWGEGVFGIQAAARFYFNKPASELNAKEGAFLAMLLPSPKRYSQSFRQKQLTPYAYRTIQNILGKMAAVGAITDEERQTLADRPLAFEVKPPAEGTEEDDEAETSPATPANGVDNEDPDEPETDISSEFDSKVDPGPRNR